MKIRRREFVSAVMGTAAFALFPLELRTQKSNKMYGLIGKILAAEGKRDELVSILLDGTDSMPGCLSYVVAKEASDKNAIWVTEVWESKESHANSLKLASVQAAITKARPMITGFGERFESEPVGGKGIQKVKAVS
jgi:quinol monooxygenase YgiN